MPKRLDLGHHLTQLLSCAEGLQNAQVGQHANCCGRPVCKQCTHPGCCTGSIEVFKSRGFMVPGRVAKLFHWNWHSGRASCQAVGQDFYVQEVCWLVRSVSVSSYLSHMRCNMSSTCHILRWRLQVCILCLVLAPGMCACVCRWWCQGCAGGSVRELLQNHNPLAMAHVGVSLGHVGTEGDGSNHGSCLQ